MNASPSPTVARPVVVGVDGTSANRGALRFAVEECRRAGAPLTLVHVVPDYVRISPMLPVPPGDLTAAGTEVLSRVEAEVRADAPDLEIESWLYHGSRSVELTRAAAEASLLVVGRDDRGMLHRFVDGDTATRTAARAPVPVVEVPQDWAEGEGEGAGEARGTVLVGVKSPTHAVELLGAAFAVARARGARLVVLHAWHLPSAYDDIIEARVALDRIEADGREEMERLLRPWRTAYPDLEVEVRIVHDRPGHALLEASGEVDLVVVVRREHGLPAATHLGGTARAVLRTARCPVMVVPPTDTPELPPLVLEEEGQLLK